MAHRACIPFPTDPRSGKTCSRTCILHSLQRTGGRGETKSRETKSGTSVVFFTMPELVFSLSDVSVCGYRRIALSYCCHAELCVSPTFIAITTGLQNYSGCLCDAILEHTHATVRIYWEMAFYRGRHPRRQGPGGGRAAYHQTALARRAYSGAGQPKEQQQYVTEDSYHTGCHSYDIPGIGGYVYAAESLARDHQAHSASDSGYNKLEEEQMERWHDERDQGWQTEIEEARELHREGGRGGHSVGRERLQDPMGQMWERIGVVEPSETPSDQAQRLAMVGEPEHEEREVWSVAKRSKVDDGTETDWNQNENTGSGDVMYAGGGDGVETGEGGGEREEGEGEGEGGGGQVVEEKEEVKEGAAECQEEPNVAASVSEEVDGGQRSAEPRPKKVITCVICGLFFTCHCIIFFLLSLSSLPHFLFSLLSDTSPPFPLSSFLPPSLPPSVPFFLPPSLPPSLPPPPPPPFLPLSLSPSLSLSGDSPSPH